MLLLNGVEQHNPLFAEEIIIKLNQQSTSWNEIIQAANNQEKFYMAVKKYLDLETTETLSTDHPNYNFNAERTVHLFRDRRNEVPDIQVLRTELEKVHNTMPRF